MVGPEGSDQLPSNSHSKTAHKDQLIQPMTFHLFYLLHTYSGLNVLGAFMTLIGHFIIYYQPLSSPDKARRTRTTVCDQI